MGEMNRLGGIFLDGWFLSEDEDEGGCGRGSSLMGEHEVGNSLKPEFDRCMTVAF